MTYICESKNKNQFMNSKLLLCLHLNSKKIEFVGSTRTGNTIWYWNDVRDKIKNDYTNPTENFVDELFANW